HNRMNTQTSYPSIALESSFLATLLFERRYTWSLCRDRFLLQHTGLAHLAPSHRGCLPPSCRLPDGPRQYALMLQVGLLFPEPLRNYPETKAFFPRPPPCGETSQKRSHAATVRVIPRFPCRFLLQLSHPLPVT